MYGTFATIVISWQSVQHLKSISGGSCGLYGARKLRLFRRIVSGVGLPYVVISWSKMSLSDIVLFQPTVPGAVAGTTLNVLYHTLCGICSSVYH